MKRMNSHNKIRGNWYLKIKKIIIETELEINYLISWVDTFSIKIDECKIGLS